MGQFLAFLGVSLVVIVTPGPDTALTLRSTLVGGRRAGLAGASGVAAGQLCWTLAASFGVAAVIAGSETLFVVVKLVGAVYLGWLGLQALRAAFGAAGDRTDVLGLRPRGLTARAAFRNGLLSDLGNPKMAAFFTSVLPQFARGHPASLGAMCLLGVVFSVLTFTWLACYATATNRFRAVLSRAKVRRSIEGFTGAVLIGLGVRIALEHRS